MNIYNILTLQLDHLVEIAQFCLQAKIQDNVHQHASNAEAQWLGKNSLEREVVHQIIST